MVKLTVTHDGFTPGSRLLQAISEGWPAVLPRLPKGPAMTARPQVVALLTDLDVERTTSGQRVVH